MSFHIQLGFLLTTTGSTEVLRLNAGLGGSSGSGGHEGRGDEDKGGSEKSGERHFAGCVFRDCLYRCEIEMDLLWV